MDVLQCPLEQALALVPEVFRDDVRTRWQQDRDQPIQPVRILSGQGGPRPWYAAWQPSEGYLWRRLRSHLIDHLGRSELVIGALDDTSNRVLAHLEDPRPGGPDVFR